MSERPSGIWSINYLEFQDFLRYQQVAEELSLQALSFAELQLSLAVQLAVAGLPVLAELVAVAELFVAAVLQVVAGPLAAAEQRVVAKLQVVVEQFVVAVLPVVAGPLAAVEQRVVAKFPVVAEPLVVAGLRVVVEPFAVAEPQVVQVSLAVGAWEDCLSLVPVELVQRALWERRESTRRRCCHSGCLIACLRRRGSSKACRVAGR